MIIARQFISDLQHDLRATGLDDHFSNRQLLSKINQKAQVLYKQDAEARRIFRITSLWKRIPCLGLCEVDPLLCTRDAEVCTTVMKSLVPIPEVFQTSYGDIVLITTIGPAPFKFQQTTFAKYRDIKLRKVQDPSIRYFVLLEGWLYLLDTDIEEVSVYGMFKNPFDVTRMVEPNSECLKPLDEPLPFPDYFCDVIRTQIFSELGRAKAITEDENADLNSLNKK